MTTIRLFEVGGAVRDRIANPHAKPKDRDFAAEVLDAADVNHAFASMLLSLGGEGFQFFVVEPEYLTARAQFPRDHGFSGTTADFVVCRKDGPSSDARHPDFVLPGTILDDLARRDFTVNAMAVDDNGALLDPHDGQADLERRVLSCVGSAEDRFREDALRALRAIRFTVTKNLKPDEGVMAALNSAWLPELLSSVSTERKREELRLAFAVNTLQTLELVMGLPRAFREAVFCDGLWLRPTQEKA